MKTIKNLLLVNMLFLFCSCSLTVDVDDEDETGRIMASVLGDNSDGSVSIGGYLEVEVNVFDRDGIAAIRVEIPAIYVDFITNIDSNKSSKKISQVFNVNEIDTNEPNTIFVTLTDKDGNSYTRIIVFTTD